MDKRLLRLAYTFEFLLALIAVFTLWSQAAGQGHLDWMPWYWKAGLGLAVSGATVGATVSAVSGERAWNRGTLGWLVAVAALLMMMGAVTYYYHLLEPLEEDAPEEQTAAQAPVWGRSR